jgi:hypothetical protein
MMDHVEFGLHNKPLGQAIRAELPQPVVEINAARTALPPPGPRRQIVIVEAEAYGRGASAGTVYQGLIVCPRNHRDFMPQAR